MPSESRGENNAAFRKNPHDRQPGFRRYAYQCFRCDEDFYTIEVEP